MLKYILRRIILMIPTLAAISLIAFIIIQLPPGDFLSYYIENLRLQGERVDQSEIDSLRVRYGVDEPLVKQYLKWMGGVLTGDFGRSLQWQQPVGRIIRQRLPVSFAISLVSLLFVYIVAIPIGTFSATNQYSIADYIFTVIGFIGLAIPNFFLALILLYLYYNTTGNVAVGFFSREFQYAAFSFAKLWDLFKHLWIPTVVIGTAGTCGLIRVMRANLLDELKKPYVIVARAKGVPKRRLLFKYPFRIAVNPVISTLGWLLPTLVSGELLVSVVLSIPTLAPVFLDSIMSQDMFLAASSVMILSALTVIGTLISDILLAWVDPRIREAI